MMEFFVLFSIIVGFVGSDPVRDIARDVKSELVLVENPTAMQFNNKIITTNNFKEFDIPSASGGALDLFYRYGFFSLSVRVVPRDDPGSWIVREPTASIFREDSVRQRQELRSMAFEPYYQLYLCDDRNELMEAYFKDFTADGIAQPWKLYTGSWRTSTMAKYMGLSPDSLEGDYSYVLVKMLKPNRVVRTEGNPQLEPEAQNAVNSIQDGNYESVLNFVHKYGSHYIKEITMGESIYQVFALEPQNYENIKNSLKSVNRVTSEQFRQIFTDYLAPWVIKETGKIKAASGDFTVQRFLDVEPKITARFGAYPDIFQFQNNPTLMTKLESLTTESEAVLGMQFSSLRFLVPSIRAREYYDEVVDTQIALWSANIK